MEVGADQVTTEVVGELSDRIGHLDAAVCVVIKPFLLVTIADAFVTTLAALGERLVQRGSVVRCVVVIDGDEISCERFALAKHLCPHPPEYEYVLFLVFHATGYHFAVAPRPGAAAIAADRVLVAHQ